MVLYEKDNIIISTLEESAISDVLGYFSENDFNCDYISGELRPSIERFRSIMEDILVMEEKDEEVLIIKKEGKCIGYLACHVEYDRLCLGHIAIDKSERSKGYGRLLVVVALEIASNEDRDVSLQCNYGKNNLFSKLGFLTRDGWFYLYKTKKVKNKLPKIFISCEDYRIRESLKTQKEVESFKEFLNDDVIRRILSM